MFSLNNPCIKELGKGAKNRAGPWEYRHTTYDVTPYGNRALSKEIPSYQDRDKLPSKDPALSCDTKTDNGITIRQLSSRVRAPPFITRD